MVTAQETLSGLLQKFNSEHHTRGSAVVTRDGLPMVSALPASINRETFAAMTATMLGAAETAASELETTAASQVVAVFDKLVLIAVGAGPELLVITMAEGQTDPDPLIRATLGLADQIETQLAATKR
jgi:uncharacterized protein